MISAGPRRTGPASTHWCILRTSGGRTLPLTESLGKAGFEVWSPSRILRRRRPRSQKTTEITAPIMPTFVFARAAHLHDLAVLAGSPSSPHPAFSIFRHAGRIPLITDREVAGARAEEDKARQAEARAAAKSHRHVFPIGQRVNVTDGAFTGLEGVIEGGDGKFALVTFGGAISWAISTFLLTTDELHAELPRAA